MRIAAALPGRAPGAAPAALCRLIEALGTPAFGPALLGSLEAMIGAGAAAVYAPARGGVRPVLGDWQAGAGRLARHTREFAVRYASQDPAYLAFSLAGRSTCLTTCVAREELPHAGHRRLMEEAGFSSRVVTLFPAPRGWLGLHVLRRPEDGELSDRRLQRFSRAAPVLGSLIARHLRRASMEERLRSRCPALTPREALVCAGLLAGTAAREIAARLGIGIASVQTYRKRAYRKLGVGSLPALFHLLWNGEDLG